MKKNFAPPLSNHVWRRDTIRTFLVLLDSAFVRHKSSRTRAALVYRTELNLHEIPVGVPRRRCSSVALVDVSDFRH